MKKIFFWLFLLPLIGLPSHVVATNIITFSLEGQDIDRNQYKTELIKLILKNSHIDCNLLYYLQGRNGGHEEQVRKLERGIITVKTFGASQELEKQLIPIRIPIFKGLIGYRVFLINQGDRNKFDQIDSLEDLRKLTGIQGKGWTDIKILEDAGLKQLAMPGNALFRMVDQGGRSDYFARAIYEAIGEIQTLKANYPNITLEKRILLAYPFAMYFYFSPQYPKLAKKFAKGFAKIVANGTFDTFFYGHPYIRNAIEKVHLDKRRRFSIPNRYLSPETRNLPAEYWFDPNKVTKFVNREDNQAPASKENRK
jgi:hypothetical protein